MVTSPRSLLFVCAVALSACIPGTGSTPDAGSPDTMLAPDVVSGSDVPVTPLADSAVDSAVDVSPADSGPPRVLPTCGTATPFPAGTAEGFMHTLSTLNAAAGAPEHSAQDVIGLPGTDVSIPGKFAYGDVSKDLEDEDIDVFGNFCAGWQLLGRQRTNSDGRTTQILLAGSAPPVGAYELRQLVLGDATTVSSAVRILPAGTHIVLFDIDGTLTTSDGELFRDIIADFFQPLYRGDYVPEAYPSAVDLTRAWAAKGYVLVYMTGRPYWLMRLTRGWLEQLAFAPAHLHLTDSNEEALPTESGVGAYKRDYIRMLLGMGYVIDYAYGNASTDVFAYREAGLDVTRTFIIGPNAGEGGTQPLTGGYTDHVATYVSAQPNAVQPY